MEVKENSSTRESDSIAENLKLKCYADTVASEVHPQRNEDDYFLDSDKGIFGIFDGMGGENNGQLNAQISRQIIEDLLKNQNHPLARDAREILKNACNLANQAVCNESQGGTTATFGLLCETNDDISQIALAHVGDSRAYLYRDGKLSKLTCDDNLSKDATRGVQEELDNVVNQDDLSEQAKNLFPTRNQITNCIGIGASIYPKIIIQTVMLGDILILTTDGIHDNLTTAEISQIISQNSQNPELISPKLTGAALTRSREDVFRSKPDDMTALVVTFKKENKQ